MKILLTGKTGKIGYELQRSLQGLGDVISVSRLELDLTHPLTVREVVRSIKPNLIVNAASYSMVDMAEKESELAMLVNGHAPGVMAVEARKIGAAMVHYSTDYVFDGAQSTPYREDDPPTPLNTYGFSKLAGELSLAASGAPYVLLRTGWVYGTRGRNFLRTVLKMAAEKDELRIVEDQYGTPIWCRTVAEITAHIIAQSIAARDQREWWAEFGGIYHLSASGQTSRREFAIAALWCAELARMPLVTPISSQEFGALAQRPRFSVLCCEKLQRVFGVKTPDWKEALGLCLEMNSAQPL